MRIAVSAEDNTGLGSPVSDHFGHCPFFVLVEVDGSMVTGARSVENPYFANHTPGMATVKPAAAGVTAAAGEGAPVIEVSIHEMPDTPASR